MRINFLRIMSLMGFGLAVWLCAQLYESAIGYTWPQVNGKVVSSEVVARLVHDKTGSHMFYVPKIIYEYARYDDNNIQYHSDRVRFSTDQAGKDENAAKQVVANYLAGKTITVYYNPRDPAAAVLEQGIYWPLIPVIFLVAVFSGIFALASKRRL